MLLFAVCTVVTFAFSKPAFYVTASAFVIYIVLSVAMYRNRYNRLKTVLQVVSKEMSKPGSAALENLKIPVVVSDRSGEIVWVSKSFFTAVSQGATYLGKNIADIIPAAVREALLVSGESELMFDNKLFTVYLSEISAEKQGFSFYYMIDQTALKQSALEYKNSRPVVAYIAFDGLDEISKNAKDSEASAFKSMLQQELEKWAGQSTGLLRKVTGDKFVLIMEERHYKEFAAENFSVLKRIRDIKSGNLENATISIGIGRGGKTLSECYTFAVQSLDMAQGRGGDQVVVQSPDNKFRFFGGVSDAVEKRTKVRTRIMASALKKLIENSDNVLIMGHKFSDLDCLGSAFGICSMCRALDRTANIVIDKTNSLAKALITPIEQQMPDCFVTEDEALSLVEKKTLLVIVDVHRASFVESTRLFDEIENVVVIDHHRKAVDHISNALIFFHETAVSSACEMVTELLQYSDVSCMTKVLAEGLLAGMMLDTKNFVLHTGVRTFEAAAYLRSCNADPVQVKKMFNDSVETYKLRAQIVSSAELYGDCAIAVCEEDTSDTRIATSQAADELLNVDGVSASFVLFKSSDKICISARSFGEMNVQVIMEALGGGGHRTMSACQLDGENFKSAVAKLCRAIDNYKLNQ